MTKEATVLTPLQSETLVSGAGSALDTCNEFDAILREDLDECFFGADEFCKPCVYEHRAARVTATYSVLKDDPSVDGTFGGIDVVDTRPKITLNRYGMKAAPRHGDTYTVKGERYAVTAYQDNGVGVVVIYGRLVSVKEL